MCALVATLEINYLFFGRTIIIAWSCQNISIRIRNVIFNAINKFVLSENYLFYEMHTNAVNNK